VLRPSPVRASSGIVRGAPWITQPDKTVSPLLSSTYGRERVGLYVVVGRAEDSFGPATILHCARARARIPRSKGSHPVTTACHDRDQPFTRQTRAVECPLTLQVGGNCRRLGRWESCTGDRRVSEPDAEVSEEALRISRRIGADTARPLRPRAPVTPTPLYGSGPTRTGGFGRVPAPHSIAVVGASSDPNTIAGLLFCNLVDSHFAGVVLPVNRSHPTVQGIAAYPDLASCPVVPDLVIVCVPAPAVPSVVAKPAFSASRRHV